ncbi:hypothetical protein TNCV_3603941 [Trichonephila clavipes]|nr:hypothetical protein TNCV_3603941 [Trichonephila clavipes]
MQVLLQIWDVCCIPQFSDPTHPRGFLYDSSLDSMKTSPTSSTYCHHINPWWISQHDKWLCHPGINNDRIHKI